MTDPRYQAEGASSAEGASPRDERGTPLKASPYKQPPPLTVRLPAGMLEDIDRLASEAGVKRNAWIVEALRKVIEG